MKRLILIFCAFLFLALSVEASGTARGGGGRGGGGRGGGGRGGGGRGGGGRGGGSRGGRVGALCLMKLGKVKQGDRKIECNQIMLWNGIFLNSYL